MSTFAAIYLFFQKYVVPAAFVIGLLYFLYGVIEYFIIGQGGDEGRSQHGRELFLRAIGWFSISLLLYAAVAFLGWLGTLSLTPPGAVPPSGGSGAGANVERRGNVLQVPNVPGIDATGTPMQ